MLRLVLVLLAGLLPLVTCATGEPEDVPEGVVEEETQETTPGAEEEGAATEDEEGEEAAGTVRIEAGEFSFEGIPDTLPAGEIQIELDNTGQAPHDVTVEELGDETVVVADGGASDSGRVTLEPGEYTFYCSVGNHRAQGMEQTVTVE